MLDEKIRRINQLAKKEREVGLTDEEKNEQKTLRAEYIAEWRRGVVQVLDNTYIVDETGKHKLQKKDENISVE